MRNSQQAHPRRGMTLVELLVVIAIMVLLLAISVPMLRPVLETQKTSGAAQVLAGALQQARTKSIREGKSFGIMFAPFETAPSASVQLRLHRANEAESSNVPHVRVLVENGTIIPYVYDAAMYPSTNGWGPLSDSQPAFDAEFEAFTKHFMFAQWVQFNHMGRLFKLEGPNKLAAPYDKLNLPDLPTRDPMEYRCSPFPRSTWHPPTVMPYGTIVDLAFSGGTTSDFDDTPKVFGIAGADVLPYHFSAGDEVLVMFSPRGHVDVLYVNGKPYVVNEILYFCVGDWDRQVDATGRSLAEDGRTNLETSATYWVALHPKTGGVRITQNAPVSPASTTIQEKLDDARKYAREHFFNVGL